MSKDPAFLFYPNDFLEGTYTLEDEQIGMYIKLLCLQHQRYKLTEKDMLKICKTYDKDIFNKFTKDKDGFYFNVRLREESEKRKAYSESRRLNRMSKKEDKKDTSKTYDKHMVNINENIVINKNIDKRMEDFKLELMEYKNEYSKEILEAFWDYWSEPNQSKTKMRKELQKTWNTKGRLNTWKRNNNKFNPKSDKEDTKIKRLTDEDFEGGEYAKFYK